MTICSCIPYGGVSTGGWMVIGVVAVIPVGLAAWAARPYRAR